ncbi:MAG: CerR family C-terminal domain-containing protein [Planctomycetes bacterium]|nr:CerR family C-terminal domain-containing protein [Planctomycetota bacterium]
MSTEPTANTTEQDPSRVTQHRLLNAGAEVFAEHGFQQASIREICRRAQANVAAVHYHYGDKEKLYEEVIRRQVGLMFERFPFKDALDASRPVEERLHAFLRAFFSRLLEVGNSGCIGRIVAREMLEQSVVLDRLVKELIRPQQQLLAGIVREMLGPDAPEERVGACTRSILGQCIFYLHARPVIQRLYPELKDKLPEVEGLAEHVLRFSLSGLNGFKNDRSGKNGE